MLLGFCWFSLFFLVYSLLVHIHWATAIFLVVLAFFPFPSIKVLTPVSGDVVVHEALPASRKKNHAALFMFAGCSPFLHEFLVSFVFSNSVKHNLRYAKLVPNYYMDTPFLGPLLRIWGVRRMSEISSVLTSGASAAVMCTSSEEMMQNFIVEQSGPIHVEANKYINFIYSNADTEVHDIYLVAPTERGSHFASGFKRLQTMLYKSCIGTPIYIPLTTKTFDLNLVKCIDTKNTSVEVALNTIKHFTV